MYKRQSGGSGRVREEAAYTVYSIGGSGWKRDENWDKFNRQELNRREELAAIAA